MKITITEALSTLKNLTQKIQKATNEATFIACHVKGKEITGYNSKSDFENKVKSTYQSIKDLIERRNKIKSAIVGSNATTTVVIGDKQYTVAAAIERKSSIELEKIVLNKMVQQFNNINAVVERNNNQAQTRLDDLLKTTFGKDSKVNPDDQETISNSFWNKNQTVVCDPLALREKIDSISDEINNFITEVDIKLSISNSTTFIEVD